MKINTTQLGKTVRIIYIVVFIIALFTVSDGKQKISLLEKNPVVVELNNTVNKNYKIVQATDVSTNIDKERGLISQEYIVNVKAEADKEEYVKLGNEIINLAKNKYSNENISKITISFTKKKGNVLLYNVIYAPNKK